MKQHVVTITTYNFTSNVILAFYLQACFAACIKLLYKRFKFVLLAGIYRLLQTRMRYQQCVEVGTRNVKICSSN